MVDYGLSGAIEVRVNGVRTALGGPKQRCVLAVLLCHHGNVVSTDRLIDCVWEDDPPAKALTSLRSYVANLRRVLNPPGASAQRLESRPNGYQLNLLPTDRVDLHRFEDLVAAGRAALIRHDPTGAVASLTEALGLWVGDPFGEFAYREFAVPEVLRYNELRSTAIEARFDAALMLGGAGDLVPELEAAVAQHPLHERLWGHLMVALHRAGRGTDAVRAFDRACATLDREVGTRPGEGLQTLFEKITDGAADLRPAAAVELRTPSAAPPAPLIVGRDTELDAVGDVVNSGVGGLTILTGEAGIGKTLLAQAIADRARAADRLVAWAAHPPADTLPRLWTWIQVLRQLGANGDDVGREAVRSAAPGVIDALVPEWRSSDRSSTTALPLAGFALTEGIVTAIGAVAQLRPLVVVLDDLHAADEASLDVLRLLYARSPRLPVSVLATWMYQGVERPFNRSALQRLLQACETRTVSLSGIDRDAAAALVVDVAGAGVAPAACDHIWQEAQGNPLYIKELARTVDAAGSVDANGRPTRLTDTLTALLTRRLSVLSTPARRALAAAAVIGVAFDIAELADVVNVSISALQTRLASAYDAGLIDEDAARPGVYRFAHGLMRETLLMQMHTAERTALHAAVAVTRAPGVATAAYEHAIAAADHAWRAGARLDPDTGVGIHELVIDRALTRSAYEDVAVLAEHALHIARALPAEPEQLERQAMLWLHLAGAKGILNGQSSAAAMDAVQCALEIGSQIQGRGFYNATALRCLMLCAHGRLDEAQIIATGLLEVYRRDGEPAAGLAGDFALSGVLSLRGDVDALIVTGRHMLDNFPPPKTVSDPMHFFHPRVYCWMALGGAVRGDGEAMSEYLTRAMELAASRGDTFNILAARLTTIECAAIRGDLDGTAELADQVDQAFRAAGALQWAGAARIVKVWAQTLTGEHPDPSEAFTAFDELTCDGSTAMTPMFLALLADIEIHHGRPDAARRLLHRARTVAEATGEHAEDGIIAQRLQALSELEGRPRRTSARGGRQFRSPLPPHRAVGHQVEHVAETTGRDERDEPRPRPVGADFETTTEELA